MNKYIPFAILALILIGGGYFFLTNKSSSPTTGTNVVKPREGGNVISSIQDAITKSMPLKCEYPDGKGNKVTTYVRGQNVRVMGIVDTEAGQSTNLVMKENKFYMWDDKTKKGTVMTLNVDVKDQGQVDKKAETIENLEKYKDSCKVENISDSLFSVPTDVEFVDLDNQFKNTGVDLENLMQQYQTTPPNE